MEVGNFCQVELFIFGKRSVIVAPNIFNLREFRYIVNFDFAPSSSNYMIKFNFSLFRFVHFNKLKKCFESVKLLSRKSYEYDNLNKNYFSYYFKKYN